jgi:hypothetical protein
MAVASFEEQDTRHEFLVFRRIGDLGSEKVWPRPQPAPAQPFEQREGYLWHYA